LEQNLQRNTKTTHGFLTSLNYGIMRSDYIMKKLLYKGIEFDDFQLYREAENSSGCEYGYPTDENLNTEGWEEADKCVSYWESWGILSHASGRTWPAARGCEMTIHNIKR
jgi:hypothetical protein